MTQLTATARLKHQIDSYLEAHPKYTRNVLAKKTGVSYSTLSRLMNLEVDVSFEQSAKILKIVASDEEQADFVKTYYPHVYRTFYRFRDGNVPSTDLVAVLSDRLYFELLSYAGHAQGLSPDWVAETYGQVGLAACQKLRDLNLLSKTESGSMVWRESIGDLDSLLQAMTMSLSNFKAVAQEKDPFMIRWVTARVNPDCLTRIVAVLREAENKVMGMLADPNHQGEVAWELGLFLKRTSLSSRSSQPSKNAPPPYTN